MSSPTLARVVRRGARRARWISVERACLRGAARGLAAGTAVLLLAGAGFAVVRPDAPRWDEARILAFALASACAALGLGTGIVRGLARGPSELEAAFALDRALGLSGNVPAALELEGNPSPLARLAVAQALEAVSGCELSQVFERRTGPARAEAALLASGAAVLALVLAGENAPLPPPPLGPEAAKPAPGRDEVASARSASRVLAASLRDLGPRAKEADRALGEAGPATRAADELLRTARALARGTPSRTESLARLAASRGRIENARLRGLGDALASAASALEAAPALKGLARALVEGAEAGVIEKRAQDLAFRAQAGTLGEEAEAKASSAAARAARSLDGVAGAGEAKSALENLSRKLDESSSKDEKAKAALRAGEALAKARSAAASDEVAARSLGALDEARDAARGERSEKTGDRDAGKPGSSSFARATRPKDPRSPGTSSGEGSSEERARKDPGRSGGGGDPRGSRREGDPRKGAGLGVPVAGKGGSNEESEKPGAPSELDSTAGRAQPLAGMVGERGKTAFFAVSGLASGAAPTERQRELLRDYRRAEEAALDRELVPLDEQRLVARYFAAISDEDETSPAPRASAGASGGGR